MHTLDPEALHQHVDRLYRSAWALCGSREDAEDLVQETFARVLARPRVLRGGEELYYLMQVLRNTFLTGRRTAARRPVIVAELEDVVITESGPMRQPEQALEMQEIFEAITGLPEDFRLALVAVDVLGLSYREAGRALGVGEATITTRLFRARKKVAERLDPQSPGTVAVKDGKKPLKDSTNPIGRAPSGSLRLMGAETSRRKLNRADLVLSNPVTG
jgi:RNA polymerase sigma-70 factor (ECF subfamily)